MAYDERLAERVRAALAAAAGDADVSERKMFGGICFMVGGNMAVGVNGEDLIVRLDPAACEAALAKPHTRPFDIFNTRPAPKGWLLVAPAGTKTARSLAAWVACGTKFARSLPAKLAERRTCRRPVRPPAYAMRPPAKPCADPESKPRSARDVVARRDLLFPEFFNLPREHFHQLGVELRRGAALDLGDGDVVR